MGRKRDIAARFGSAAQSYDSHAEVQRHAADTLAASLPDLVPTHALEIGCGTGYLSQALITRWPQAQWLFSDISADMLAHCRRRLGRQRLGETSADFAALDAEHLELDQRFDLIASSLAFQWFEQPAQTLAKLFDHLAPGGQLHIATLGAGSFAEWRDCHDELGLPCGTSDYPNAAELRALVPSEATACLSEEDYAIDYGSGRDFLRALKGIGAGLPECGYRGLSAGEMRKVLREFDSRGDRITYHLLYLTLEKRA